MRNDLRFASIAAAMMVGLLDAPRLRAQTPEKDAAGPAFEVASVKPNKSRDGVSFIRFAPGGRLVATNMSLRALIRLAYEIKDFQLSGGPNWIRSDRFDIEAKSNGDVSQRESWLMMRSLMADRFKLAVHSETRNAPIYALVMARNDGKLGPQLQLAELDCAAVRMARSRAAALRGGPPPPPPPPGMQRGIRPTCGSNGSPGWMAGGGINLSELAIGLSREVDRFVVDRTGLTGEFDYQLEWTPDQVPQALPPFGASLRPDIPPPAPADGPSIFTAVQEQLGLKLESTRGPVDVLVIDHVERPTED
jgi:uncharacterized protein (TIGR03435 family)